MLLVNMLQELYQKGIFEMSRQPIILIFIFLAKQAN
jgi:hypothetical protein